MASGSESYLDSGRKLSGQESDQCKIFINSQTWAVVSGAASEEKGCRRWIALRSIWLQSTE